MAFGRPDVDAFMSEMSATDFQGWISYYQLDPWGNETHALNAGIIASTIANVNRSSKSKAYEPKDFMPLIYSMDSKVSEEKKQAAQEAETQAKLIAFAMGVNSQRGGS